MSEIAMCQVPAQTLDRIVETSGQIWAACTRAIVANPMREQRNDLVALQKKVALLEGFVAGLRKESTPRTTQPAGVREAFPECPAWLN